MKPVTIILLSLLWIYPKQVKSQVVDTMINVGNYNLHFKITKGKGKPILFESGGGNDATQWDKITNPIHQATNATLITYDRQGFGKSGIDTSNFNILNEIKGLEYGLKQLGYGNSSLIIVSHSLGAFYAHVYASRHPKQVKGLVMFDPRIGGYSDMAVAKKLFNSIDQKKLKHESTSLYYILLAMEKNSDYVRKSTLRTTMPISLIMAEFGPYDTAIENEAFTLRQKKFIKKFPNGSILNAKGSAHNIPQDKPLLAIREIVSFYKKYSN
jgi:pimeloyl-ACP methyl ester carboxylesterase